MRSRFIDYIYTARLFLRIGTYGLLLTFTLLACSKVSDPQGEFHVQEVYPPAGAEDIGPSVVVSVVFNRALDTTALPADGVAVVSTTEGRLLSGELSVQGDNNTLVFTPNTPLATAAKYSIVLSDRLRDWDGNELSTESRHFDFSTAAQPPVTPTIETQFVGRHTSAKRSAPTLVYDGAGNALAMWRVQTRIDHTDQLVYAIFTQGRWSSERVLVNQLDTHEEARAVAGTQGFIVSWLNDEHVNVARWDATAKQWGATTALEVAAPAKPGIKTGPPPNPRPRLVALGAHGDTATVAWVQTDQVVVGQGRKTVSNVMALYARTYNADCACWGTAQKITAETNILRIGIARSTLGAVVTWQTPGSGSMSTLTAAYLAPDAASWSKPQPVHADAIILPDITVVPTHSGFIVAWQGRGANNTSPVAPTVYASVVQAQNGQLGNWNTQAISNGCSYAIGENTVTYFLRTQTTNAFLIQQQGGCVATHRYNTAQDKWLSATSNVALDRAQITDVALTDRALAWVSTPAYDAPAFYSLLLDQQNPVWSAATAYAENVHGTHNARIVGHHDGFAMGWVATGDADVDASVHVAQVSVADSNIVAPAVAIDAVHHLGASGTISSATAGDRVVAAWLQDVNGRYLPYANIRAADGHWNTPISLLPTSDLSRQTTLHTVAQPHGFAIVWRNEHSVYLVNHRDGAWVSTPQVLPSAYEVDTLLDVKVFGSTTQALFSGKFKNEATEAYGIYIANFSDAGVSIESVYLSNDATTRNVNVGALTENATSGIVVWATDPSDAPQHLWLASRFANGTWNAPRLLDTSVYVGSLQALSQTGHHRVVWTHDAATMSGGSSDTTLSSASVALSENQQDITTTAIAESKVQYNFPHLLLDGAGFRLVWTQSHLPSGIARGLYTAVAAATQAWGEPVLVPGTRDSVSGGDFNAVSTDNGFMLAWTLNAMSTSAANVVVKRYDNTLGWGNTQGYHADFLPDLAPITALYQTTSGAGVLLLGPDTHDAINATVPRVLDISGF